MLTNEELKQLRTECSDCSKPLYLFDDDPDGVAAFLYLYHYKKEGKGILIKARPELNKLFATMANNYGPDRIFILDVALMNQEFKDLVKTPISWVDHHDPQKIKNMRISYYNPRTQNSAEYTPTSYWIYHALHTESAEMEQLSWIAAAGCIGDHFVPEFLPNVLVRYPFLSGPHTQKAQDIEQLKFHSPLGKIVRMFSFLTMGPTPVAHNNMTVLTRIIDPKELLEGTTIQGRFLIRHFEKINTQYQRILNQALEITVRQGVLLFIYTEDTISVTKELANELIELNKQALVIVGRERQGDVRMSLRYNHGNLKLAIEKALESVAGHGGGHEMACGASVKQRDLETFITILKKELGLENK